MFKPKSTDTILIHIHTISKSKLINAGTETGSRKTSVEFIKRIQYISSLDLQLHGESRNLTRTKGKEKKLEGK